MQDDRLYRVDSEVGRLRQVILHRPGLELKRLTPGNKDRLLFDDVLWVGRAQAEHDRFAEVLRGRGVAVHLFDQAVEYANPVAAFQQFGRYEPADKARTAGDEYRLAHAAISTACARPPLRSTTNRVIRPPVDVLPS